MTAYGNRSDGTAGDVFPLHFAGGALGLLYDLLRALRALGGRVWGGVLDGVYCVLSASLLFFL